MKTLSYVVILLISFAVPVRAAQVYSGCATPPSTFRHVWYFDPVHGKTRPQAAMARKPRHGTTLRRWFKRSPAMLSRC